jgi:hypothetical protein
MSIIFQKPLMLNFEPGNHEQANDGFSAKRTGPEPGRTVSGTYGSVVKKPDGESPKP